ncbi:MAG TPA: prolipoprotein diacylglyceryl transferase [Solirubrobacteraceae bacterium]|nr:prolipoprotein diacylglyceryl transferase [Solirubrobacteraceae bacterium]
MQPQIHVFGLTIQTFGVMFALGFLAAGAIVNRRMRELGTPPDWAYELTGASLVGGLVGARVYYVVQHWSTASHDLLGSLFSGSGLVWYGGAIGGALAVIAWAWWRGFLGLVLLDVACIPLTMGYAIGRIGCQLSGDGDYGKPWHGPWAMSYPHGTVPTTVTVHPTPVYETLAMGLLAIWLWRMRERFRPGALFAWYLVLSGIERFLIEFLRRNDRVWVGLTPQQFESVALIAAGVIWLWLLARRGGLLRERPGPARASRAAAPATAT